MPDSLLFFAFQGEGGERLHPDDLRKFNFHIRRARGELLFARCWILGEGETEATLIPETARIMKKDFERAGIRFVTYQTGISLEPCLKVANGMGINWVVLADNDLQGAKDHQVVRNYLNGRSEKEALFIMPEANMEQHLCMNGFLSTYESFLTEQSRKKITVTFHDASYPIQVGSALSSKLKIQAAMQVISSMEKNPHLVPSLFRDVILKALELTETS